jgi:signal transduction histidine kinase/ActR/RegA family two-component response regulator
MAIRRSIVLYRSMSHDTVHPPDLVGECVALAISALMLVGVVRIGPFFLSIVRSRDELQSRTCDLHNRVRELNCLFAMADLLNRPGTSLEDVLQGTVDLVPSGWQYPQITCARVLWDDRTFATGNFEETPWSQSSDLLVGGRPVGCVQVCYLQEKPPCDEGPFLKEERSLINAIAERLGRVIERRQAEEDRAALQKQLNQAQKMEAIGLLAGGVAHDFNNLLTVIRGNAGRVRGMLAADHQAQEALIVMEQAAQQATGVTRSLLTFSRELPVEKKPVDLCALVEDSTRLLRRMIPAAIELEVQIRREPPLWVSADQTQLQQVVLNLAINARDAMPDGGTLRVAVAPAGEPGAAELPGSSTSAARYALLEVADTGVGMPPETRERVFEPFFTTKERGQGTGLGLSVVHGIVEDHGGDIEVQSEVGRGSTFAVFLPCTQPDLLSEPSTPSAITPRGQGELILLAEDDAHVRGLIALTLESLGYRVLQASDGAAVLDMCDQHRQELRLFILDLDLPKRSGLDCLSQIRQRGMTTPVVAITGNVTVGRDIPDDKTVLMCKPFDMPELARIVWEALGKNARQEAQP